jgi:endonuclease/exonuclease/phosphatase family metal-dependent hydrolase
MTRRLVLRAGLAALLSVVASSLVATREQPRGQLAVMTFNIRYGTANDAENSWPNRREFLFDVMRDANADLVGLQEALDGQMQELLAALPQYAAVGVGRDDGLRRGEFAAILYRRDRFAVSDAGTFWFSDTPEVIASKTWGNSITRICTWARLVDRDGAAFWLHNLHLDHQSQPSRERSAALLLERITSRRLREEPVIVTGDFNAGEDNPVMTRLTRPSGGDAPFVDTFRVRHPGEKVVGTANSFKFGAVEGDKIDYILVQPGTEVLDAAIVRTSRDGRYPSDHFPVTARITLPPH